MGIRRWISVLVVMVLTWGVGGTWAWGSEEVRQELRVELRERIEEELSWAGSEIEMGPLEVIGPMPERGWSVRLRGGRLEGVVQAEVVSGREGPEGKTWVRASVEIRVPVYRATEVMEGGEAINGRYRREMERLGVVPQDTVQEPGELRGQTARRRIREGELLTRSLFEQPRVIERNDLVTVLVRRGAITVSLRAQALQGGRVGDSIRVRNVDSDQSLIAIVRDSRTVEVP